MTSKLFIASEILEFPPLFLRGRLVRAQALVQSFHRAPGKKNGFVPQQLIGIQAFRSGQFELGNVACGQGQILISIFRDPNFGDQIAGRRAMEIDMLKFAIEDISMGAMSLAHNQVGLIFRDRKVQTFLTPLGTSPGGNVVVSLSLKKRSAFKKFRNEDGKIELEQDEVDSALYYLTFLLSEVIG